MFYYNPNVIIRASNTISKLNYWLEDIILPKKMRKHILSTFRNLKEKTVLELGCGVGTLTMNLAEEVGPSGKIIAIDLSEKNIDILKKRLTQESWGHIETVHDEHMINRIHPTVRKVDMVFSVGHLSYIQDLDKVLKELYDVLPESGRILFVEYIDFFYFLPNRAILSNKEELKKTFKKAGFSVNVTTKNGLFWKYILIYGIKTGEEDVPVI
jgi:ubiquinone/menaquinone biosynthesis C-methylase UbiE